ncbi:MAG TPA: carboxypeptidase regulatory-like domain-containing protein [Terriglobales bacterium]|nr:carboxypeptidase regulatory-like domain-containing protein [Terriglobales bacterium]
MPLLCVLRSPKKASTRLLQLCVLFFGCALAAFGQEATIVGTVTDLTGAVVPSAVVTLTNLERGTSRTTVTNGDGQFVVPSLSIGHYNVRAESKGFKSGEEKGIVLNVGDRTRVDFKLEIGNVTETVSVEATTVGVQTDTGAVSTVITGEQVSNLGINGRSLYALYALTPGASSLQGDKGAFTPVSGDSTVSINGQRAGHNLQILDGGENLDRGGSSASVMPSVDAVAEFNNQTSNYSAEYGLSSAATITTVVKSGTKTFHASAWEFFRNDALDARNFFLPAPNPVQELRFNVFGFNVGGQVPLWKEHPTFFFYNQEWRREVDGGSLNQNVPPATAYPDANGPGTGAVIPATYNGVTIAANTIDPLLTTIPASVQFANCPGGVAPAGVVPGSRFPNDTIPDCMIAPNATALLNAGGKYGGIFPQPSAAGNGANFLGGNNSPTTLTEEIARVDHTFSSKLSVFGHYVQEQVSQTYGTTQWSGDNVPSIADVFNNPSYSAVVHATYVISPTLLNETAFNYNGNRIHIVPDGLISAPSDFTFNRLFTGPNQDNRIPTINLSGVTGSQYTANWTPWNNKADDYQLRDDVSWTKGAHQLKFGFSWALYKKSQEAFANTQGNFTFNGLYSGYDFADYLLGYTQAYSEDAVKITGQWNNISLAAYAQDNWRVTPRLTLNLGLRWDGIPHTYEANQQSSNFYPQLYNPANAATFEYDPMTHAYTGNICGPNSGATLCPGGPSPGLSQSANPILAGVDFYTNGIGIGGKNGIPKGLVNDSWANFGPRLGFSYDLTGKGKTVLRGGFGVMYERVQGNDMYNGAVNVPGDLKPTRNNVSLSNPGLDITSGNVISSAQLPVLPANITGIAQNYKPPVNYQYSLGIQQSLGARAVFGLSYVGNQSRHENFYQEVNLPPLADVPALVKAGGAGINQVMQYLGFNGIKLAENEANGSYNSLQVDVHGNVRRDLQLQVGYTYAHAVDEVGDAGNSGGDLSNSTNPYVGAAYDRGPSAYDRTHVAFINFVYQLPFFKDADNHFLKAGLGGWEFSGIITAESGAPLNLGVSGNNAASVIPNAGGSTGTNTGNRPNVVSAISYPHTVTSWFNPASFAAPACQTGPDCWGNLGYDGLRGPGRDNWNLSLLKNFTFTERFKLQFRAESFNVWNHTQFKGDGNNGGISTKFGAGNFGAVTGAFDPRVFQLALKAFF